MSQHGESYRFRFGMERHQYIFNIVIDFKALRRRVEQLQWLAFLIMEKRIYAHKYWLSQSHLYSKP